MYAAVRLDGAIDHGADSRGEILGTFIKDVTHCEIVKHQIILDHEHVRGVWELVDAKINTIEGLEKELARARREIEATRRELAKTRVERDAHAGEIVVESTAANGRLSWELQHASNA